MPTLAQVNYVKARKHYIREPILIVGSKIYDYDRYDFFIELASMGYHEILGIDLRPGHRVDYEVDLCDEEAVFFARFVQKFNTIVCMSVLMCVPNPFLAASNLARVATPGATLLLSEPFIHKTANMPKDHWRFTTYAIQQIFPTFAFHEDELKMVMTRNDTEMTYDPNRVMIRPYSKHADETRLGYLLRKIHRKVLAHGVFQLPLFPEIAVYALGVKQDTP